MKWTVLCSVVLFALSFSHAEDLLDDLDAAQKGKVLAGEQVMIMEDVAGKPWPRLRIYRIVESTPEEAIAVFFDYSQAKSFVPNILKSEISKRYSPTDVEVDYGVSVPVLPDEFYTARNRLVALPGGAYRVDWKLVRAVQTKDSEGSICVEQLEGKTVLRYKNLVVPGSSMAGLLRGTAVDQMKQTVAAIGKRIESQKTSNPQDLEREVAALREALGQKKNAD